MAESMALFVKEEPFCDSPGGVIILLLSPPARMLLSPLVLAR